MENAIYIISIILSSGVILYFYLKGGKPYKFNLWLFVRGSIYWALLGAIIYVVLEFIFL